MVIERGVAVEKLMRSEIEAAAQEIMDYLDAHGDLPVLAIKDALGRRELSFYMGLGELILQYRVLIQESDGVFWARRAAPRAKAA